MRTACVSLSVKNPATASFDDCSVVTAPYRVDDDTIGVLGVIGPTRMAYDRVVPIVDVTARLLETALGHGQPK